MCERSARQPAGIQHSPHPTGTPYSQAKLLQHTSTLPDSHQPSPDASHILLGVYSGKSVRGLTGESVLGKNDVILHTEQRCLFFTRKDLSKNRAGNHLFGSCLLVVWFLQTNTHYRETTEDYQLEPWTRAVTFYDWLYSIPIVRCFKLTKRVISMCNKTKSP